MFTFLKEFFVSKQTFTSAMGDLAGVVGVAGAFVVANPQMMGEMGPAASAAAAFAAYLGGAVSGKTTGQ
jgi:hypothetical protein